MANITRHATPIKPSATYTYFDKIQFWLHQPLDRETRAWLRSQCRRPKGFNADSRRPARFDSQLRERIEVRGITRAGLRWLAQQNDILVRLRRGR